MRFASTTSLNATNYYFESKVSVNWQSLTQTNSDSVCTYRSHSTMQTEEETTLSYEGCYTLTDTIFCLHRKVSTITVARADRMAARGKLTRATPKRMTPFLWPELTTNPVGSFLYSDPHTGEQHPLIREALAPCYKGSKRARLGAPRDGTRPAARRRPKLFVLVAGDPYPPPPEETTPRAANGLYCSLRGAS